MSSNRDLMAKEETGDRNSLSFTKQIALETTRVAMVGGGVAAILAIPDAAMHRIHTSSSIRGSLVSAAFYTTIVRAALKGFPSSATSSTLKNSTLGQRSKLEDMGGVKEVNTEIGALHDQSPSENISSRNKLLIYCGIAGFIGVADTTLTQYHANKRTWTYQQVIDPQFKAPQPATVAEYFKTFRIGYNIRASRNIANVTGFLITPRIEETLSAKLPNKGYLDLSGMLAATLSGVPIGAISNVFDILYKNQVINVTLPQITAPSIKQIAKDLIAKEGMKALRKGLFGSIFYTSTACFVVPKVEKAVESVIQTVKKWI